MKSLRYTPGNHDAIASQCLAVPPELLKKGVAQFNAGAYFACHETLEKLWLGEKAPVRDLYKGIIQIGGAFFHLDKRNRNGALIMLPRGLCYVSRFSPACQGVDVAGLAAMAAEALAWLVNAPPEARMPEELVPKIRLTG